MFPISFQARLTLLSVLLVGPVLLAFGGWAWFVMQRTGIDRMDQQIKDLSQRQLGRRHQDAHWEEVETSLRMLFGEGEDESVLLLVKDHDAGIVEISSYWPTDLKVDALPMPEWGAEFTQRDPSYENQPPDGAPPREYATTDVAIANPPPGDYEGRDGRPGPPPHERGGPGGPPPRDFDGGEEGEFGRRPPPPQREQDGAPREGGYDDRPPPRDDGYSDRPPPRENRRQRVAPPMSPASFLTQATSTGRWRIGVMGNPYVTVVMGVSLEPFYGEMAGIRNAFILALAASLLAVAAGGCLLSRRALRPVAALSRTLEGVTAKGLGERVPSAGEDPEFERLIGQFNAMMDRLEKSFGQAVRFSADAAHELKTPLAILQGRLESAVQDEAAGSVQQEEYSALLAEVQRLKAITRKLLLLSMADAGELTLNPTPFNLSESVESIFEDMQILADGHRIRASIEPGLWVSADSDLLTQVLQNLSTNARKYCPQPGDIKFWLRAKEGQIAFTLWNTGMPIPEKDRDKIFDRFYRADPSRNRRVDGVGLGLSLSREIVRAHQGELTLEPTRENAIGFTVVLPPVGV